MAESHGYPAPASAPGVATAAALEHGEVSIRELIEAGVHFGHQTRRWDPRMKPFLFGERNGVHILDLDQTLPRFRAALDFVRETAARGGKMLFVGTKRQAQAPVQLEAARAGQYYVNNRWLGGMLTNFKTVKKSIERFKELLATIADEDQDEGSVEEGPRGDGSRDRQVPQVARRASARCRGCPTCVFVIDVNRESIAVSEAQRLGIPIVAVVDSNCNPVRHRLRGPRQRRFDPRDPALLRAAGGRLSRGRGDPQRPPPERGGRGGAGAAGEGRGGRAVDRTGGGRDHASAAAPRAPAAGAVATAASRREAGERRSPRASESRDSAHRRPRDGSRENAVAEISAQAVKALRDQTGAGMMDCKKVLADAGGDLKRAIELLRERGLAKAGKREGRATSEGVIAIAIEGRRGGIVELGCETDFVARTDDFTALAADLARTVARDAQASSRGGAPAGAASTARRSPTGSRRRSPSSARTSW